ncbi:MAG: tRNA (adenosine(37)-N6)-dimethylallyltransferase MiaA [Chloroflexota bacterium]|nr:tRNA (adenosine(37)-N6)-dimethylallyltransferase MiaA [Chloroflexota bacterium]
MREPALIPLVVIMGPTGIGKTRLAAEIGPRWGAEVISVDSRQFYRGMDIGTAKPSPAELAQVRQHLIDIAAPDETVGLARFLELARPLIQEIHRRGKLPFLVGGTGQYIRALLQGWQVPHVPPDPELRAELEALASQDPDALWQRLLALDAGAVEFIHPHNLRRIIRALEVSLKAGQPFSELRRRIPPPYRVLQIGLTMEREALYARVDARVEAMLDAGLEEEVRRLLDDGYGWELPAMSGLGYSQLRPYLAGECTLAEAAERIKLDTHDFIRRQYTWFNGAEIRWVDVTEEPAVATARLLADFVSG